MTKNTPWFAPVRATFPAVAADDYPHDLHGVPDPLDLIALTAPDGTEWLSLIRARQLDTGLSARDRGAKCSEPERLDPDPRLPGAGRKGRCALETGPVGKELGRSMDARRMQQLHSRLLATHPRSPDWDWADGNAEPRGFPDEGVTGRLYQPIAWYGGTGTSRESAGTSGTYRLCP